MSRLNLPLVDVHYPTTFAERGVAMPFTTPVLLGARSRPATNKGIEFLLPNPSGGRGVYIVRWLGVRSLCHPTVHDTLLHERAAALPVLSPAAIRLAAREVAAEGYAGQSAKQAAEAAQGHELTAAENANRLLLGALVEQTLLERPARTRPALSTEELEQRSKRAIMQAGSRLGCTPDVVGRGLTVLARSFASVGIEAGGESPRLAALLSRMHRLQQTVAARADPGVWAAGLAQDIARSIHAVLACSETLLRDTRARLVDMLALLRAWRADPAAVLRQVERLDWLLDGWDHLCLLWETAQRTSFQRTALLEIAQLVPVLPTEIQAWIGRPLEADAMQPGWRVVSMDDGWRSGAAAFALTARNERLRAMSV